MYIGRITGIAFLPVSIILFLNSFGYTSIKSIFGFDILLLAAIGIIIVEISDIIDAHIKGDLLIVAWVICLILCFPAVLFFMSKLIALPSAVMSSLPLVMASFLFVEGLTSFYIGD